MRRELASHVVDVGFEHHVRRGRCDFFGLALRAAQNDPQCVQAIGQDAGAKAPADALWRKARPGLILTRHRRNDRGTGGRDELRLDAGIHRGHSSQASDGRGRGQRQHPVLAKHAAAPHRQR